MSAIRIDLGCGEAKREGFIGLDNQMAPGVDYVLDLTKDRFPFDDGSVDQVFSSHFLEHIAAPNHVFQEISRVCKDGAKIEFWTPYAFSNEAFLYGHETFLTEEPWMHFCYSHRDTHLDLLRGRWLLLKINYIVSPETEQEILNQGFSMDFAIRYFKSVITEFGVEIEFRRDLSVGPVVPRRTYSRSRQGERLALEDDHARGPRPARESRAVSFDRFKRYARKLLSTLNGA